MNQGCFAWRPDLQVNASHTSQEESSSVLVLLPWQNYQVDVFLPTCVALSQGPNTRLLTYDTPQQAGHLICQALLASCMKTDIAKKQKRTLRN